MSEARDISISLVSHTNQGKTTLVRTLLRRDVGAVLDKAHVTDENRAYPLVETEDGNLVLWDTPGFGNSVKLLKRLKGHTNPVGWFMGQVWDRFMDRPLWCGQQAMVNCKETADIVLYLVNAMESPEAAGYIKPELEILTWMDRPVILVLNQTGAARDVDAARAELERWQTYVERYEIVKDVVSLDAFTRCWVQEDDLMGRIAAALPEDLRTHFRKLGGHWHQHNLAIFESSTGILAKFLAEIGAHQISLTKNTRSERKAAARLLREHARDHMTEMTTRLIEVHSLEGRSTAGVRSKVDDLSVTGKVLDERKAAVWGGLAGGLAGGLMADILSGGLTFGGGAVVGALTGLLGSAGLARTQRVLKRNQESLVYWTGDFMMRLTEETLMIYLAVAHFGRGRGEYRDLEDPKHWQETIDRLLQAHSTELEAIWNKLRDEGDPGLEGGRWIGSMTKRLLADTIEALYPGSREALRPSGRL